MADAKIYRLRIQSLIAALMLVVYTAGTIGIDLLHHSLHDHTHHALPVVEPEKDPCHLAIYEPGKEGGCNHSAHITEAEKCKFSHVVFHSNQLLTYPITIASSFDDYLVPCFYVLCASKASCITQSLRGPPAV